MYIRESLTNLGIDIAITEIVYQKKNKNKNLKIYKDA